MTAHDTELERIRAAYRQRDARPAPARATSAWSDPGYRFYMQRLEWELLEALGRAGAALAGGRALEVGCGSGYFLHRLEEYGAAHAAGIDLMEERIEPARARYPTLELVTGDASALPWEDGSFDVVTQFTCLSSILDPGLRAAIAGEMWRVLRPGGVLVSYDMRRTPAAIRALGRLYARMQGTTADAGATPTVPLPLDEVRRLWPAGDLRHRVVSLNFEFGVLAVRGRWFAELAAALPALRTHLLVTVRKPS